MPTLVRPLEGHKGYRSDQFTIKNRATSNWYDQQESCHYNGNTNWYDQSNSMPAKGPTIGAYA